ncbi:ABC transporter permease subunit [Candidatus Thioglobus sp.]|jgi:putative spermidine/putrescine transport system permease protein|uniref:ABC transporter permease n=1 Tax=Candidatus Pseudothioglobus sp. Uisw_086 TaxID=3230998 RepID=UPI0023385EEF|nr:ABC transporter permease subunit [Candidatus Thioglobus sp.]MDB9788437.1 ABC transporter permease subunit [Candidatus Thioglobus sp.]MDB9864442.1 ABC transporter permease subunit [Candidatus Thioglobus sp.]MDB9951081.1 ABC transporter permease subunit [Candidatus Thioglobus sp.]MDB9975237.1 ABC transporter permease subunit [Candidatus Thioglobus sp.]|tara:strand:- start:1724 stop:2599 length:876 start_codon:yes stop_codon:yes gene_type:complete
MGGDKLKIVLSLTPPLLIIGTLFFGGILYGFLQSLGYQPTIGRYDLNFDAYYNVMFSERYAKLFWSGLALNLWVSFVSTFLAAAFALWGALSIRKTFFAKKICNFIFSLNLPMPHLVVAVGMIFVFSQSGLLARFFTQIGFIASPSEFPILVKDKYGFGIILAYIWKEAAFFFIILMSVLQSLGENFEELAQSLGANKWQRFRYVILPLVMPNLFSASIIVFAFSFGAYEVPAILGVNYPQMLPVMSLDFFLNPDLNARSEGMALSMIIAFIVMVLVVIYFRLTQSKIRKD